MVDSNKFINHFVGRYYGELHTRQDQILLVLERKRIGICVYRRSYLVFTIVPRSI